MVYLSCTTVLSLFVFGFASSLYRDVACARAVMHSNLYLQLARDVVRRDLLGVGEQLHDYVLEHNIFKKYWIDAAGRRHAAWIGYQVGQKGLARFQGSYDQKTGSWKKKSVSYLPAPIDSLDLSCHIDGQTKRVRAVMITYSTEQQGKKQELRDRFLVRNRVL